MKIVITSGGTREPIDPVRFIGNYSTGKMGAALAEAFVGHEGDDAGVKVSLASPNEVMREILAISRYDRLFTITEKIETD